MGDEEQERWGGFARVAYIKEMNGYMRGVRGRVKSGEVLRGVRAEKRGILYRVFKGGGWRRR